MAVPLLALHGTFGRGGVFDELTASLGDGVRVVAPDQRAHGHCPVRSPLRLPDFVDDAAGHARRLGAGRPVVVLGHSFGGTVAAHLAATHPGLVSALVIVDIGPRTGPPEVPVPVLDVRGWPRSAPTHQDLHRALADRLGQDPTPLLVNAEHRAGRVEMLIDWDDMMAVQRGGVGDHRDAWTASPVPLLLVRAARGFLLSERQAERTVADRPNSRLVTVDSGHWVHDDAPAALAEAITSFLGQRP